jgi:hypothetical protein
MNIRAQQRLFFEDFNDALREVVGQLGGAKVVGRELWPEKTVEQAQTLLLACLNSERKERLTPDQVLLLLRKARQADCHAAMEFIGQHAGYEVKPIRPQDEAAELIQRADAVVREARSVAAALERLTHPPLRSIGGDKG